MPRRRSGCHRYVAFEDPSYGSGFALERDDQSARSASIPVFTQIDPLPRAQEQSAVANGHRHGASEHGSLDMGRHIVGTLQCVNVGKAFGNDLVHRHLQVDGNVRVRVLVYGQRGGCVLNEHMEQAKLDFPQFRQCINDL